VHAANTPYCNSSTFKEIFAHAEPHLPSILKAEAKQPHAVCRHADDNVPVTRLTFLLVE